MLLDEYLLFYLKYSILLRSLKPLDNNTANGTSLCKCLIKLSSKLSFKSILCFSGLLKMSVMLNNFLLLILFSKSISYKYPGSKDFISSIIV